MLAAPDLQLPHPAAPHSLLAWRISLHPRSAHLQLARHFLIPGGVLKLPPVLHRLVPIILVLPLPQPTRRAPPAAVVPAAAAALLGTLRLGVLLLLRRLPGRQARQAGGLGAKPQLLQSDACIFSVSDWPHIKLRQSHALQGRAWLNTLLWLRPAPGRPPAPTCHCLASSSSSRSCFSR